MSTYGPANDLGAVIMGKWDDLAPRNNFTVDGATAAKRSKCLLSNGVKPQPARALRQISSANLTIVICPNGLGRAAYAITSAAKTSRRYPPTVAQPLTEPAVSPAT